jgi:tetratricopeptide (TPR) repeat protein
MMTESNGSGVDVQNAVGITSAPEAAQERLLSEKVLEEAARWNEEGVKYFSAGRQDEAVEAFEKSLDIMKNRGEETPDLAAVYNNLGTILRERGLLEQSLGYFKNSQRILMEYDPRSREVAATLNNIGTIYDAQGKTDEAIRHFKRCLVIEESLAPDSLGIATTYNNIGVAYTTQKKYEDAASQLTKALTIQDRIDPDSLSVATTLMNVGGVLKQQGKLEDALNRFSRTRDIRRSLIPGSLELAAAHVNIAKVLHKQKKLDEALGEFSQGLTIQETLQPGSADVASTYTSIGAIYEAQERTEEALELLIKALEIEEKIHPASKSGAEIYEKIRKIVENTGDLSENPKAQMILYRARTVRENSLRALSEAKLPKIGALISQAKSLSKFLPPRHTPQVTRLPSLCSVTLEVTPSASPRHGPTAVASTSTTMQLPAAGISPASLPSRHSEVPGGESFALPKTLLQNGNLSRSPASRLSSTAGCQLEVGTATLSCDDVQPANIAQMRDEPSPEFLPYTPLSPDAKRPDSAHGYAPSPPKGHTARNRRTSLRLAAHSHRQLASPTTIVLKHLSLEGGQWGLSPLRDVLLPLMPSSSPSVTMTTAAGDPLRCTAKLSGNDLWEATPVYASDVGVTDLGRQLVELRLVAGINGSTPFVSLPMLPSIFAQVASGLEQLHARGIVHRDVKPDVIRVTCQGVWKVVLTAALRHVGSGSNEDDDELVGGICAAGSPLQSSFTRAPEVLLSVRTGKWRCTFDTEQDSWSLGCLVLHVIDAVCDMMLGKQLWLRVLDFVARAALWAGDTKQRRESKRAAAEPKRAVSQTFPELLAPYDPQLLDLTERWVTATPNAPLRALLGKDQPLGRVLRGCLRLDPAARLDMSAVRSILQPSAEAEDDIDRAVAALSAQFGS